jgi:arsenate reductase (glutaredoxin)
MFLPNSPALLFAIFEHIDYVCKSIFKRLRPPIVASRTDAGSASRRLSGRRTRSEGIMQRVTLYHNPGCKSSRGAMELLSDREVEFDTIEYLKHPPTRAALEQIIAIVEGPVADLVRKDKRFGELGLKAEEYVTKETVVALLLQHPELMQRPIVIRAGRALIARPPEKLLALF